MSSSPSSQLIECGVTRIERVTIFPDRAEIRRRIPLLLEEGINEITLNNVLGKISPESVRASGTGSASIHEVQLQTKKITSSDKDGNEKVIELKEALEDCEKTKREVISRKTFLKDKQSALQIVFQNLVNSSASDPKSRDSPKVAVSKDTLNGFRELFDFYEKQALEFRQEEDKLTAEERELTKKTKKLNEDLSKYTRDEEIRVIKIVLEAERATEVNLMLSYQVLYISWKPSYDLRVETGDESRMNITYTGRVSQESGEDWTGCQLVLSTATPSLGGALPELGTLDVTFMPKISSQGQQLPKPHCFVATGAPTGGASLFGSGGSISQINLFGAASPPQQAEQRPPTPPPMQHVTASVEDQTLSAEYTISRPVIIPCDGAEHKVTIGVASLTPRLSRECVPSKDKNVYLTASVTNTSPLSFLSGEANIFLDGNFITKTQLKSISPGEHFKVSLGVDPSIKIDYKPAHNKQGEVGFVFGKANTNVTEQKLVVKNARKENLLVTFYEQIPRSTNEKILVKLLNPSAQTVKVNEEMIRKEGALINEVTNNLEWTVNIGSQKQIDLSVKYQIEYPQEERLKFEEIRPSPFLFQRTSTADIRGLFGVPAKPSIFG